MSSSNNQHTLAEYLTIGEAAEFLGVSPWTLRNWDKDGKLKTLRHPKNGYRIYRREDLVAILSADGLRSQSLDRIAPYFDARGVAEGAHVVQFYESDRFLVGSVSRFIGAALEAGEGAVIIATDAHRSAIQRKLRAQGLDLAAAREAGQFVSLDAAELLAEIMVDGIPDAAQFRTVFGSAIGRAREGRPSVRAFGEMVALLWASGQRAAAIRVEEFWNDLQKTQPFALYCAYPIGGFDDDDGSLQTICKCHSRVIPAESYAALGTEEKRLQAIAQLQQQAHALKAEIAHRQEVEARLIVLQEQQQQEIRERRRTEEALRLSEERHRQLADNLPAGFIYQIDHRPDGFTRFTYISGGVEALCGVTPAEVMADATKLYRLIAEADLPRVRAQEEAAIRQQKPFECQFRSHHRTDFVVRWLHCRSAPRSLPDGGSIWDGIAVDITERMAMEQALREADRRKNDFLVMLAHELRNPLAPIRNALQIMRMPDMAPETLAEAREMMVRQVHHMARLIDDLLDVSRVTRGKIQLKKEAIDLAVIVTRAVEGTRSTLNSLQHQLKLELPCEPVPLLADPARIEQVLVNLLMNAAKYTPPGGTITVMTEQGGDHALVRVRDTGVGIAADLLPRIFDLFVQADQGADRTQGGLGIGLTMVKNLVEMHGGSVAATSAGPGQGSEFTIKLPLAPEAAATRQPGAAAHLKPGMQARRILVVDDHDDAAESLAIWLRLQGHEVQTAGDGPAALELTKAFQPDVVFLDIGLPGMDGYETARRMRQADDGRRATLVALTGYAKDEDCGRSSEAGFSYHLVKPADPKILEKILAEVASEK